MADEEGNEILFNRQEAEKLLPLLNRLLSDALGKKRRLAEVEREFEQVRNRILLYGGILPPYGYLAEKKVEREGLVSALREAISEIEQTGCVVKDLALGLVDFPSIVNEEQVYLCWKLGEERIRYWHRVNEGYTARKPLRGSDHASPGAAKPN